MSDTGCEFKLSANCGTRAWNSPWSVWTNLFVRRVLLSGVFHGDEEEMRSDSVHGRLKTTGMTTAPQFQLQRFSRGWV